MNPMMQAYAAALQGRLPPQQPNGQAMFNQWLQRFNPKTYAPPVAQPPPVTTDPVLGVRG